MRQRIWCRARSSFRLLSGARGSSRYGSRADNTSNQARQVDLSITTGGSTSPQTQEIGLITLAPGATQQVDYDTMLSKLKTQPLNGFVDLSIGYTGHTGDVEIDEGSVDQSGNYVFEVSPQSEVWTISKTICHWSVLGDTNTMVSLWNYSSQAQDLTLTLHYSGGQYVLPVHLNPRADTELDIASLIRNGVPDQNGSVIPQSITEGSAVLSDAKDRRNKIYVASSTSTFNVRNGTCTVSCGTCDGFVSGIIQPQPLAIVVKGTGQATGEITYDYGTTYTQPASSANWSTSNGAIATVSTSGTGTGVAPGTANFEFIVDDLAIYEGYICMGESLECPYGNVGGQGPVNVALTPDHLLWFSDLTERSSACAIASQNATLRIIGYQAVTANNATAGPVAMKENFANISPLSTCSNPLPSPTPCVPVNGDGTFTDFITTNACAPPNPITCGYSISPDNWQYCGGITPVTIGQPNYSVLWRAVYVDGSTASVPLLTPVPK